MKMPKWTEKVANFHTYIKRGKKIKLILESFNNGNEG